MIADGGRQRRLKAMAAAEDKRPRHFEQHEQTAQEEQPQQEKVDQQQQQQQQQGQQELLEHQENHEQKEQQQQAEPTAAAAHLEKQERELRLQTLRELTPEAYLDQTGVSSVLEEALGLVARLRPQDPLNLLSDM